MVGPKSTWTRLVGIANNRWDASLQLNYFQATWFLWKMCRPGCILSVIIPILVLFMYFLALPSLLTSPIYCIAPNFCATIFHEFLNLPSDHENFPHYYSGHGYVICSASSANAHWWPDSNLTLFTLCPRTQWADRKGHQHQNCLHSRPYSQSCLMKVKIPLK